MIKSIILQHFRNYRFRQFEFINGINFIIGNNGIGKTNLLEAISLISGTLGIREAEIKDLNQDFNIPFSVGFETEFGSIGVLNNNGSRKFIIDGDKIKAKNLTDKIKVVSIIPEDEFIFKFSPSERRKFFDKALSFINKSHAEALKSYKNLTLQRIKILDQKGDVSWLTVIEKQIAELAVLIAINRVLLLEEINLEMIKIESNIQGKILLTGELENKISSKHFIASLEEQEFANRLLKAREIDRITKKTLTNYQKANFEAWFTPKDISSFYASSGEQKRLLFLFFIAVIKVLIKKDFKVIFLIDEVIAKLDLEGKNEITKILQTLNVQTFLTGTEADSIKNQNNINLVLL